MALTVVAYDTTERVKYVPKYEDNREAKEPMFVELIPACAADVRKIEAVHSWVRSGEGVGEVNFAERHNAIQSDLVLNHVKAVHNMRVKRGGDKSEPVTTAKQLVDLAPDLLLEDIANAVRHHSKLSEGEKKQ